MKAIPAIILIGNGAKVEILSNDIIKKRTITLFKVTKNSNFGG